MVTKKHKQVYGLILSAVFMLLVGSLLARLINLTQPFEVLPPDIQTKNTPQEVLCYPVIMQGHVHYTSHEEFIEVVGMYAHLAKERGIFPSVMIAQALLESGADGSSGLAKESKNLFGVKGKYQGEGQVWDTLEDEGNGNYYEIEDEFRHYDSYYEAIQDYLVQLTEDERYQHVVYASTPESQIRQIKEAGYATDDFYVDKIIDVMDSYDLRDYNEEQINYDTLDIDDGESNNE